jgi:hypothetical protein
MIIINNNPCFQQPVINGGVFKLIYISRYPVPVHHLHVRPINGRTLMSPTPTIIPITQILNFVILNICT